VSLFFLKIQNGGLIQRFFGIVRFFENNPTFSINHKKFEIILQNFSIISNTQKKSLQKSDFSEKKLLFRSEFFQII
jgi:hypothetical protein